jgi:CheY-like chemotaxis protein
MIPAVLDKDTLRLPSSTVPDFAVGSARSLMVAPLSRLLIYTSFYQQCLPLTAGAEWSIGRETTNAIILPDKLTSRQHAMLRYLPQSGFALLDLRSANGSYLNGKRMDKATLLKDGDLIHVGNTEIHFQQPVDSPLPNAIAPRPKHVLMIQSMRMQGEIWREILNSQGISVTWIASPVNVSEVLAQLLQTGLPMPQLLLLDIGSLRESPYDFCRHSRDNYPDLKIILTSTMRTKVFSSEQRWAKQQGAYDLFPGFHRPSIFPGAADMLDRIRIILDALDHVPRADHTLGSTLQAMQSKFRKPNSQEILV